MQQLTRRQFFAVSAAATFVASLPRGVLALPANPAISLDAARKTIQLREPMHFRALHRLLCDLCDRPCANDLDITSIQPTLRVTDHIYEFQDDWRFADEQSRRMIRCGSYREGDDLYSSILTVGRIPPADFIQWRTDDAGGFIKPGEAIPNHGKPIVFNASGCKEYRIQSQPSGGQIAIPMLSPDPTAVDAGTLSRNGWTDVSEVPQGLLVET